ncbi:chitinase [Streptoalloteichus tenebrarius]|uniref:chitinase n=1 Tax=Streptoalloteichus tenebrarius (strain ATCC 17920 / DSM 40477 / JCM 4838 / CBS 697.72 / NBRC 16177 / NCIMB 11028 / NRRL B-12390 / A12253. 1 / ISP 5477) TaxID=1933 RepID=A0ABT1HY68_STRSD|nr:glycoside hydrolase family 18 chitinase [Streptoalloteichus tenebrarius]MCP2260471.1 chitinase [Streptoalloteichus tenebrarius]
MPRRRWQFTVVLAALLVALGVAGPPAHGAGGVTATFTKTSDWGTGYEAKYTIKNGGATALTGWTVEFELAAGQRLSSLWEGSHTVSGQKVTVRNVGWNGSVAPGAQVSFGFGVSYSGAFAAPVTCTVNGAPCDGSPGEPDTQAPSAPGNLRGAGATASSVDLAWDAATDNVTVTGYDVYQGETRVGTTARTSFTVSGLAPKTAYTFTVRARDAAGNVSAPSKPVTVSTTDGGGGDPGPGGQRKVGYFTQWGVYDRGYLVKNLETSGTAAKLTHINYAFGNVSQDGRCFVVNQAGQGDAWADYQRRYNAAESVDGVGDTYDQPLAGNFNQIRKLKAKHPNLKVNLSLGGWTWSKYFSNAALTDASRKAFVSSCLDLFIKGNLPKIGGEPQGGPGVAAGIFDGIDIDWEWPGSEGEVGNVIRPEDKQNFTLLLAEFRRQLDAYGAQVGRKFELTAFLPADPAKIEAGFEVPKIFDYLDFGTVQGYDLHGAWEKTTNHQSAIRVVPGDPSPPARQFSIETTIKAYTGKGAPKGELVLGVPFYGRGWTGVTNANNGLFQSATDGAPGTYEKGIDDYKKLKNLLGQGYKLHRDEASGHAWLFNGTTFWTYDDPIELTRKARYARDEGLGGAMIWSLDGDTAEGELMTAVHNGLSK